MNDSRHSDGRPSSRFHYDKIRKLRIIVNGDHCILCVRKVTRGISKRKVSESTSEQLLTVTKAVVPEGFLSTLNLIWPYISQRESGRDRGERGISVRDVLEGKQNECSESLSERSREDVQFSRLPTLCQFCADKVNQVETLMKAVRSQVEVVRNIILESKRGGGFSWRAEQFERECKDLRDDLEREENVASTSFKCSEIQQTEPGGQSVSFRVGGDNDQDSLASSRSVNGDTFSMSVEDVGPSDSSAMDFEPDLEDEDESSEGKNDPDYIKSEYVEEDEMEDNSGGDESVEGVNDPKTPIATNWSPKPETDPLSDKYLNSRKKSRQSTRRKHTVSTENAKLSARYGSPKTFKCTMNGCKYAFSSQGALTNHLAKRHPEAHQSVIICTCGERFVSEEKRRRHLRRSLKHKGEKIEKKVNLQTCDMCGASVAFFEILEHVRSHTGDFALKCPNPTCSFAFTNSSPLQYHLCLYKKICWKFAFGEGNKKTYACENCEFKTDQRLTLRNHMKQIHERATEKPFVCPISGCEEKFAVRQSVDFHLSIHNFKPITTQRCDQCSEIFKLEEIITHMQTNHDVSEPLKCQQCPLVFSARIPLIKHVFVHRSTGLMCDICNDNVKYLRYSELCRHYSTEHRMDLDFLSQDKPSRSRIKREDKPQSDSPECEQSRSKTPKKYSCDVCYESVSFTTQSGLASHKIRVHGEEPYKCGSCDKTFTYSYALTRHEKVHAGMKYQTEFKCEMKNCGKVFDSKKKWTYHLIHSHAEGGGRSRVCEECGKSYVNAGALKTHHDTVHLGLRPFICDTCGETFTSTTSLKRHTLIHTGDRPFSCDICGQRFRLKDGLRKHIESHQEKGDTFKPKGPMKKIRKRLKRE